MELSLFNCIVDPSGSLTNEIASDSFSISCLSELSYKSPETTIKKPIKLAASIRY